MNPEPAPRTRPPKVLVVDDEGDIVEYLSTVLEDEGFSAAGLTVADGALDWIRRERPDLVLLDVMMPGRTGLSLFRAMREDEEVRGIPVVIISGCAREEEFEASDPLELRAGALRPPEGYLEKPISVPRLLSTMRALLPVREARDG
jgi:CheY-like chemotaxis protein